MNSQQQVTELLDFIDNSPSPFHAVANLKELLQQHGFSELDESNPWNLKQHERYFVIRDESSIIAFISGSKHLTESGFKILGAHTDSPGLKIRPNPEITSSNLMRIGVEIYGGPILATFSDRDLSLAGRVSYRNETGSIDSQLVHFKQSLLRLPNLAIHLNREVNEDGLKFHKQNELALIISDQIEQELSPTYLKTLIESETQIDKQSILAWDLNIFDTQKGVFWGDKKQFFADSQLDNLASCHAGIKALLSEQSLNSGNNLVLAFFDHEEIGSLSSKGADGNFLLNLLERISDNLTLSHEDFQRTLAQSYMVSADMAHAYHPGFPNAHDNEHQVHVNQGPVIKLNSNQRYASDAMATANFMNFCLEADIPFQQYSHRADLACGSTIGPMSAAKVGISTVDVGNPMWAMHSIRESAGTLDHAYFIKALQSYFGQS